jgi:hypothetical protein
MLPADPKKGARKDPTHTLRCRALLFNDADWGRVMAAAQKQDRSISSFVRVAALKAVAEIEAQLPQTQPNAE